MVMKYQKYIITDTKIRDKYSISITNSFYISEYKFDICTNEDIIAENDVSCCGSFSAKYARKIVNKFISEIYYAIGE